LTLPTGIEPVHTSTTSTTPTLGRRNLLAAIAGYGWTSVLQLVATPILLQLLGPESFGLFGFYMAAQGVSQIFDLGLSPTINREMARAVVDGRPEEAHDLLATVERGYWAVGMMLGLAVAALAPFLTGRWVGTSALPGLEIQRDVALIGVVLAVQWPISLYEGGLIGLQRMSTLHFLGITMRTTGVAAGLAALYFGPRELWVYLSALAAASLVHALLLGRLLRRAIPRPSRPARWNPAVVYQVWRFAAGMSAMSLLGAVLTHSDKLLLSRLLPLGEFGYYTLANMVSAGLYVLILPVFYAIFPLLSGRVAAGDVAGERDAFHLGAQALAVLVIPAAMVIALFASDLLLVWTASADTARRAAPIVRLLVIGTALNGLMNAPYALQLAHGRTRIGISIHVGLILVFLPATVIATRHSGAVGAAWVWIGLNILYLLVGVPLTHHWMLRGEVGRWLIKDVLGPGVVGISVAVLGWLALSRVSPPPLVAAGAAATLVLAWLAAAMASSRVRRWVLPSSTALHARRAGLRS
jgi:O-antigen/teichoic acid export membrane protein